MTSLQARIGRKFGERSVFHLLVHVRTSFDPGDSTSSSDKNKHDRMVRPDRHLVWNQKKRGSSDRPGVNNMSW